jgi:hypothetical protein
VPGQQQQAVAATAVSTFSNLVVLHSDSSHQSKFRCFVPSSLRLIRQQNATASPVAIPSRQNSSSFFFVTGEDRFLQTIKLNNFSVHIQ